MIISSGGVVRKSANRLAASGLFDREFYVAQNGEIAGSRIDPLKHYLKFGAAKGRDPHPLFNTTYYLQKYPDVASSGMNPLLHYVAAGAAEGRFPNRLFDSAFYLRMNPTVAKAGINPLAHYYTFGWKESRQPHPLFDGAFYRQEYADVEQRAIDPLTHYLHYGAAERRYPSPWFDVSYYLQLYPDVSESGMDPLEHYILHGAAERREPHPLFETRFHLQHFGNDAAANANPLRHYVEFAAAQGAWPNHLFDPGYYLRNCNDEAARANPALHYSRSGWKRNQNPHPLFDGAYYRKRYPDVEKAGINPLGHYLRSGAAERRNPNAWFDSRWYIEKYPDVAVMEDALEHYILRGAAEGRDAGPVFQTQFYLESNPQLVPEGINPLADWMMKIHAGAKPRFWNRPAPLRRDLRPQRADAPSVVEKLAHRPVISVLMPTFNGADRHLRAAIESVRAQTYPHWQLCICDDGSTNKQTLAVLGEIEKSDDRRISVKYRGENGGISRGTNEAMAMATGEYVAMLDHDDELLPDALLEIAEAINADLTVDVLYTDQAYISADGDVEEAIRKPDWSPKLFWGVMYVGHLLVVRRELAHEVGAFDPRYDNVQDYEFMLRVAERTERIVHVPEVLYYWRRAVGSVAEKGDNKPSIPSLQARAVNAHLERLNIDAEAQPHPTHAHRLIIGPSKRGAKASEVSIFVRPTGDTASLERCLKSIFSLQCGTPYKVFVVGSNGAVPDAFAGRVKQIDSDPTLRAKAQDGSIASEYWVSMNGNLELISPNWLEQMIGTASLRGVAYACPVVLQANPNLIDEAGLILGLNGSVGSAMRGWLSDSDGHAGSLSCLREVSAVSDVCVAARREVALRRVEDEEAFRSGRYRMAHRSAKLRDDELYSVCNPQAVVRQFTPAAGQGDERFDAMLFADLWYREIQAGDRFHNASFARTGTGYL
jgi:hypothetical protein